MAGQAVTTQAVARALEKHGWTVVYTCLPGRPHVDVVPVHIVKGSAKQRYPDVLAFRDDVIKFLEVEQRLSDRVIEDISLRFCEIIETLSEPTAWTTWREQVRNVTGHILPPLFRPECELVICTRILPKVRKPVSLVTPLGEIFFAITAAEQYQ